MPVADLHRLEHRQLFPVAEQPHGELPPGDEFLDQHRRAVQPQVPLQRRAQVVAVLRGREVADPLAGTFAVRLHDDGEPQPQFCRRGIRQAVRRGPHPVGGKVPLGHRLVERQGEGRLVRAGERDAEKAQDGGHLRLAAPAVRALRDIEHDVHAGALQPFDKAGVRLQQGHRAARALQRGPDGSDGPERIVLCLGVLGVRADALLQVVSDADLQRGRIAVVFHAATRSFLQFFGTNGVCFACSIISDTPRKQTAESGALRAFGAAGSRVAGFLPRAGVFYEKSRRAGAFLAAL